MFIEFLDPFLNYKAHNSRQDAEEALQLADLHLELDHCSNAVDQDLFGFLESLAFYRESFQLCLNSADLLLYFNSAVSSLLVVLLRGA